MLSQTEELRKEGYGKFDIESLVVGDRVHRRGTKIEGVLTQIHFADKTVDVVDDTGAKWNFAIGEIKPVDTEGNKDDGNKPMMDLLDPAFLEGTAKVLTFGAKKYAPHNWRKGIKVSRLIAACLRHLTAIMRGEDLDPETKLHHGYHLACEVMFLTSMLTTRKDMDDRYRTVESGRDTTDSGPQK